MNDDLFNQIKRNIYDSLPNLLNKDSTGDTEQLINMAINTILFIGSILVPAKSVTKIDYQSLENL